MMRALAIVAMLIASPPLAACPSGQPHEPKPHALAPFEAQPGDPCVPDWTAAACQRARAHEACAEANHPASCAADLIDRVLIKRTAPLLR